MLEVLFPAVLCLSLFAFSGSLCPSCNGGILWTSDGLSLVFTCVSAEMESFVCTGKAFPLVGPHSKKRNKNPNSPCSRVDLLSSDNRLHRAPFSFLLEGEGSADVSSSHLGCQCGKTTVGRGPDSTCLTVTQPLSLWRTAPCPVCC